METDIISQAGRCAELARLLLGANEEARQDWNAPADIHEALLRLYYAKKLEDDIEACQALLTEDTSEETVDTVGEAAQAVQAASDAMFDLIESHSASDDEFAAKIEALKLDDAKEGLYDLLCKLYKCEGIIRMAYRCAKRYPTYGLPDALMGGEPGKPLGIDSEGFIAKDMDVDIMALLDARAALLKKVAPMVEDLQ
jgi:hypothetical protein